MSGWLVILLLIMGAVFMFLAALGIVRLPDFYTRLQAATKAGTLGAACVLMAVALREPDAGNVSKVMVILFFIVLTAPVAASLIGRAAYIVGVPLWSRSVIDDLHGRYEPETRALRSGLEGEPPEAREGSLAELLRNGD
jgi:multicomponent Na+:H+ antiporter subunit G